MSYLGDFALGDTLDTKFCTTDTTGAPTTLAGTPAISAYVGNSVTQITAGITLTVDFDGVTGLHNVRVVATSGNGYATASNYQLVITTGTVGGTSVVGYVVAEFSLEARAGLRPTTAGRTLDVSATGEAGVDWANVGSPSTSVNLSATTTNVVNTATAVTTVNGLAANVITAASMAADAGTEIAAAVWNEDATGHQTTGTFGQAIGDPVADTHTIYGAVVTNAAGADIAADLIAVQADTDNIQTRLPAALVSGRMDASVGAMAADTLTASALAADAGAEIAAAVWDLDATAHQTAGTFGQAIGDPGADTNTIYKAVVTDAAGATVGLDVVAIKAETASIQADTDDLQARLPAALVGGRIDASVGAMAADVVTAAALAADAGAELADALLDRNMATGTDSGSPTVRTPRQALRALRNHVGIVAGTLTVTKEDDTTASWTAAVTTAAGNPITDVDPA